MRSTSKKRLEIWAILHLASTVLLIGWNYLANAQVFFDRTVGDVSDKYRSSFAPADYAFAIWGVIFSGLLVLGGFCVARTVQRRNPSRFVERTAFVERMGAPFVFAQLTCGLWVLAWLNEFVFAALLLLALLLFLLAWVVVRLDMELFDAPWPIIAFVWWPLSLYVGWIAVAFLANVGAALTSVAPDLGRAPGTAVLLALILVAANLLNVFARNMREACVPAIWALVAVFVRHLDSDGFASVRWTALGGAILLAAVVALHAYESFSWPPSSGLSVKPTQAPDAVPHSSRR